MYQVAEISWDETEHFWVNLDGQREIHSVLMMHGRVLHRSAGGHKFVEDVVFETRNYNNNKFVEDVFLIFTKE